MTLCYFQLILWHYLAFHPLYLVFPKKKHEVSACFVLLWFFFGSAHVFIIKNTEMVWVHCGVGMTMLRVRDVQREKADSRRLPRKTSSSLASILLQDCWCLTPLHVHKGPWKVRWLLQVPGRDPTQTFRTREHGLLSSRSLVGKTTLYTYSMCIIEDSSSPCSIISN